MNTFSDFERYLLSQEIRSLNLPALSNPDTIDLEERACRIGYDGEFCARTEGHLQSLMMLLGVLPSTAAERAQCIGQRSI